MITRTKGNENAGADAFCGADKTSMEGRTSAAVPAANMAGTDTSPSGDKGRNGADKSSAGGRITGTKKPTISAVLTVRLAIVPVLKSVMKENSGAESSGADRSKEDSGAAAKRDLGAITAMKAIALLPVAVVLTVKKTSSMMKTMTRITVALRQDMASHAAVGRAPIEIGEFLLARIN
jgi:hypothetical protein